MNTADLQTYGMNVLLHSILLSLAAFTVTACFKNPHARSLSAALGLLALSIIPWITALQVPARTNAAVIPVAPLQISNPLPAPVVNKLETGIVNVREIPPPSPAPTKFALPDPWILLAGIWALGFAFQMIRRTVSAIRIALWKSSLRHPTAAELQTLSENPDLPIPPSRVRISEAGSSPCVTGCFRSCLVFPENLLAANQRRELDWALRHEAGHLRGHDLQWLALFQLILAAHWWNPAVHRLVRTWADAREQLCDHLAVTRPEDRANYATFLVALGARRMNGAILAMADRGTMKRMKRRLHFLMEARTIRPCGGGFVAGGALAATLAGLAVSQLGVRAEAPSPPTDLPAENTKAQPDAAEKAPATAWPETLQIKYSTRFLTTSKPFLRDGEILNESALQMVMRQLAEAPGTDLITTPSVTAKPKQNTTMEIIREFPEDIKPTPSQTPAIDDPNYRFAGIRIGFAADVSRQEIDLNYQVAIGHIPGKDLGHFNRINSMVIPWKEVRQHRAKGHGVLKPSQSLCASIGEIDPGRHVTMVVTAVLIDGTGRAIDATGQPISEEAAQSFSMMIPSSPQSRPPLPPFTVFVDGTVATLDKEVVQKILSHSSTPPPCFVIANSEELNRVLKNTARENLIPLPRVELSESIIPVRLWEQFPDFSASFTPSDNPALASFWWACGQDQVDPIKPSGSLGLVGDHFWCFEVPSGSAEKRRLLILNADMVEK